MNYGSVKYCDIANGEGVRTSLFVSGCRHRCRGCFQPETWDFSYGKPFTPEVAAEILHSLEAPTFLFHFSYSLELHFLPYFRNQSSLF